MKSYILSILCICILQSVVYAQTEVTCLENVEDPQEEVYAYLHKLTPDERKEAILQMITTGDCEYKGIKLYGKVKFVDSFPDIKIQYVTSFPDIKVKFVDSSPDSCGKWEVVDIFPDFKVQIVTSFPDIKVKIVDSFPGMR